MWWKGIEIKDPRTDFKGVKIRGASTTRPGLTAIGAESVNIPVPELFTAVQQGVVSGCTIPIYAAEAAIDVAEWADYGKYIWLDSAGQEVFINVDVWNKIPAEAQKKMIKISIDLEKEAGEHWAAGVQDWVKKFESQGIQFPVWDDASEAWWKDTWQAAPWADLAKKGVDIAKYQAIVAKYK